MGHLGRGEIKPVAPMRIIVMFLALLAGAKVWTQDNLFRAGAEEALVLAYREPALAACRKQTRGLEGELLRSQTWNVSDAVRMMTGNPRVKVQFWQVDHDLWSARYRNPYLVIGDGARPGAYQCEFDILYGQATIVRG